MPVMDVQTSSSRAWFFAPYEIYPLVQTKARLARKQIAQANKDHTMTAFGESHNTKETIWERIKHYDLGQMARAMVGAPSKRNRSK